MSNGKQWKNRIVGSGVKRTSEFLANPFNWRLHLEHQRQAVKGSLDTLGWIQQVIENVRTGHLVDGHERVWQALDNDDAEVPYLLVDLSEEEEKQALATLDPITALATTDREKLAELLDGIAVDHAPLRQMLDELAWANGLRDERPPSLADLADEFGESNERQFWPTIKIQVSPAVKERFDALMRQMIGVDDAARFEELLKRTESYHATLSG